MKRVTSVFILYICASLVAASAEAQDTATRIKLAQDALGMIRGPQRTDAINTMEYWGTSNSVSYHVSLSYSASAMRVDITQTNPGRRAIYVVNDKFAWNETFPGAGFTPGGKAAPAPNTVKNRLLDLWSTPHGALKMAERAGSTARLTTQDGATIISFPLTGALAGIAMKVTLNAKNQVEKVQTQTESGTPVETVYSDYKDLGETKSDVLFPSHIVRKQGGVPVLDLTITKTDCNNPHVVFTVPPGIGGQSK